MLELNCEYSVSGFWSLFFADGTISEGVFGVLEYKPQKGAVLKIITQEKNKLHAQLLEEFLIDKIVGTTTEGKCFLFGVSQGGHTWRTKIAEYQFFAQIVTCATKLNQTITEEYELYDLQSEKDNVFYECRFEINNLLKFISGILNTSEFEGENKILNFETDKQGKIKHEIIDKMNKQFMKEFRIELDLNSSLYFHVSWSGSMPFIGLPRNKFVLTAIVESKQKLSIASYLALIEKIKYLFIVLADNKEFYINKVTCSKELNTNTKSDDDWSCEEYAVLFSQQGISSNYSYCIAPKVYKGLKHLCSAFEKAYKEIETYPDLFYDLPNTNSSRVIDNLVSLVKIIDNAFAYLCDKPLTSTYNKDLEKELKEIFKGHNHPKEKTIIKKACTHKANLQDKLNALIDNASILSARNYKNIEKIIKLSKDIRNKHSHGEILIHLRKNNYSIDDIILACSILRCVIYIQLFKKLKFNIADDFDMLELIKVKIAMHTKDEQ